MTTLDRINSEIIGSSGELLCFLDRQFQQGDSAWWDSFYRNRAAPVPFFINAPDENLVRYVESGLVPAGSAFDIGCGAGRNSIYLKKHGFDVEGIDYSETAIRWAEERSRAEGLDIRFINRSVFDLEARAPRDFVYDAGLLHHVYPHRRGQYLSLVLRLLKPRGLFGLICFNLEGGSPLSDYEVYGKWSMEGGIAFTREKLERLFSADFEILEFRTMKEMSGDTVFGKDFLNTVLFRKRS